MGDHGILGSVNPQAEVGRAPFYARASEENLAPLWRVLHGLVTDEPRSAAVPAHWRYETARSYLMEACDLISTEESQRRVLVLENPGLRGQSKITPSLFAGLQVIRSGEVAPPHRHVASALRFIVEGSGAYTAVGGERTTMSRGDFVITPSWSWHDHGNESEETMVWLDGLDMHIVNLFSASFREDYPAPAYPVFRPEGSSFATAGHNLVPVDFRPVSKTSPIFNYRYVVAREALDRLSRYRAPDACYAYTMHYINPLTGGPAMPTLSTAMQLIPKGFRTAPYRSTAGTVFSVAEGHGRVFAGSCQFEWKERDLFVIPSWHLFELEADSESVLFSYSDRICQEKLAFFREERGIDPLAKSVGG